MSPGEESIAVTSLIGAHRVALDLYPLSGGTPEPHRRGVFRGLTGDLEWLPDGRLVAPTDSARTIRVVGVDGTVSDIPMPDSLGRVQGLAHAPTSSALAVTSGVLRDRHWVTVVSRLDLGDGQFTVLAHMATGGALEAEPTIAFASDAWVESLAHDDRRAIVAIQDATSDLWVLRAKGHDAADS